MQILIWLLCGLLTFPVGIFANTPTPLHQSITPSPKTQAPAKLIVSPKLAATSPQPMSVPTSAASGLKMPISANPVVHPIIRQLPPLPNGLLPTQLTPEEQYQLLNLLQNRKPPQKPKMGVVQMAQTVFGIGMLGMVVVLPVGIALMDGLGLLPQPPPPQ